MTKRSIDNFVGGVITLLVTLGLLTIVLPLIYAGAMSVDARPYLAPFPPHELSLQWYQRFFSSELYMRSLGASLTISLTAAIASTAVGAGAAIALSRLRGNSRDAVALAMSGPQITPHVVLGFGLLLLFSSIGLDNGYARLILGHIIITIPYVFRLASASLVGVPPSILDAASSLGARPRRILSQIVLPMIGTGLVVSFIFALAISLDDVAVAIFLTDASVTTLPVAMVGSMKSSFDLTIAAASMVLVLGTVILLCVLNRFVSLDKILTGRS